METITAFIDGGGSVLVAASSDIGECGACWAVSCQPCCYMSTLSHILAANRSSSLELLKNECSGKNIMPN